VLVHSIFWLSQHQYTSHRPFWSLQPPPSYFDTYFSWFNRRRCEIELTELQKNWSFTMVRECFGLKIPTHRSKQRQQTCLSGRAFKNVDQRPPNGLFLNEKVSKWLTCRLFLSQILRRFFHSNTMTLQSLTMYNGTLPLSRWMWLITTPTFQPRFSRAALFLPFHIFFYNLIGLFVLRNARNQHWSGEHICIRLRVKQLDPESSSYER